MHSTLRKRAMERSYFDAHCHLLGSDSSSGHESSDASLDTQVLIRSQLVGTQPSSDWSDVKSAAECESATPALGFHPWFVWSDILLPAMHADAQHDNNSATVAAGADPGPDIVRNVLNAASHATRETADVMERVHDSVAAMVEQLGLELHANQELNVGETGLDHAWTPRNVTSINYPTSSPVAARATDSAVVVAAAGASNKSSVTSLPLRADGNSGGATQRHARVKLPAHQRRQLQATQLLVFNAQLALAGLFRRQVSIHCVRAFGLLQTSLTKLAQGGVEALCSDMPPVVVSRLAKMRRLAAQGGRSDASYTSATADTRLADATVGRKETCVATGSNEAAEEELPKALLLHSWSGSADVTRQLLRLPRLKLFFGVSSHVNGTGDPCKRASRILAVPPNRMLLESDMHFDDVHVSAWRLACPCCL
jgi:Tat protein secretion system quality control protein TatD with DNase activity